MKNNIIIRKAELRDISSIQDVAYKTWHDTYNGLIPVEVQNKFLGRAYSDINMPGRIERTCLFVAEEERKVVGFANFFFQSPEEAELGALYIYPSVQRKNIGTKLLEAGIKEKETLKEIFVEVEKDNLPGTSFYKKRGFELLEVYEEELYGHKLQTKRMKLRVDRNLLQK